MLHILTEGVKLFTCQRTVLQHICHISTAAAVYVEAVDEQLLGRF